MKDHEPRERSFRLREHPWVALVAIMGASLVSITLAGMLVYGLLGLPEDATGARFVDQMTFHLLAGFVLFPFVLRLPKGKRTLRQYLGDIGLGGHQRFARLLWLGLSCGLILALSQVLGSLLFCLLEGRAWGGGVFRGVLELARLDPFDSPDVLLAVPSVFEEVAFRGVALTVFLAHYSERKSIVFSSIGFSLMHLLNLTEGRELEWVLAQLVWTFILGLFYGYVFVRTRSLIPSMTVHFLSNATLNALSGCVLGHVPIGMEVLYQVIFAFGIVPTTLMILWTRFFTARWLSANADRPLATVP